MKPGYPGIEKIKPNLSNREKPAFKPGSGNRGLFTRCMINVLYRYFTTQGLPQSI